MKKIFFLALTVVIFLAGESRMNGKSYAKPAREHKPVSYKTCPVCGMVRDSTWTLYTIYKTDTVWFCRAADKTEYDVHPKKYTGELK